MANQTRVVHTKDDEPIVYYENLAVVRTRLQENEDEFRVGHPDVHYEQFSFNSNQVHIFTRSAKARISKKMSTRLRDVLVPPGIVRVEIREEIRRQLQAAFDFLYNYYTYKGRLSEVGQTKDESLCMFIFINSEETMLVAHVTFYSFSQLAARGNFTVDVRVVCHLFQYFEMRETDFEQVMNIMMTLNPQANNEETEANNEEEQANNEETLGNEMDAFL